MKQMQFLLAANCFTKFHLICQPFQIAKFTEPWIAASVNFRNHL